MFEKIDLKNVSEWWYLVNRLLNNKEITSEKDKDWRILNKYFKELQSYFYVMQYELKIDENSWFAYLEESEDIENLSLSKKQKLSFWVTLLLIILREYIYKKEIEDIYANAYVITLEYIKENLWIYLREKYENDDKKIVTEIKQIINKTIETSILSEVSNWNYKINKLIKAKLNVDNMEKILESIKVDVCIE